MDDIKVKVLKVNEKAILPSYQTDQAAGMDLYACIDAPIILKSMNRCLVPTGLSVELPVGYELQIRARSSLALKYGVTMANGIGTIDSDYRGELGVILINLGKDSFTIEPDMRIAQMVVTRHEHVIWNEVTALTKTLRGQGGFGSTGI